MATAFNLRPSSVIKLTLSENGEYEIDDVTCLVTANTQIGDVVYNNSGTWTLVAVANTANAAGVIVDERLRFGVDEVGGAGSRTLQVLRRGAIVDRQYLNYAADIDTDAERTAVETQLLTEGIKTVNGE